MLITPMQKNALFYNCRETCITITAVPQSALVLQESCMPLWQYNYITLFLCTIFCTENLYLIILHYTIFISNSHANKLVKAINYTSYLRVSRIRLITALFTLVCYRYVFKGFSKFIHYYGKIFRNNSVQQTKEHIG